MILALSNTCSDPGLAAILTIVKRAMNIFWILGPILAMIGATIAFIKLLSNPDEKKYKNLLKNMSIALIVLLLLPPIVNTVMKLFDDTFELSACWNAAEITNATSGKESSYINKYDRPSTNIYTDPNDYKPGDKNTGNSGGSSTTSVSKVIFVGDSRTVGMQQTVGSNNDIWSCKSSMGLDWMKSTGIPNISGQITNGSAVVILMGVNDLYHVDSYISYINSLVTGVTQRGGKLYFVSVNPTSRSADYLNADIDSFNSKMKHGLSGYVKYIDTNSYLKTNGFSSGDGIHYSTETYKKIYYYIKSNL